MAGIFNTLNTSNKGLMAQQTALHTTAHNISNANTEGYSRQRVEMKADLSYSYGSVGQLGTGVKMESVIRMVDEFTGKQIRQETSTLNQFQTKAEVLEQVETIFNEPSDTGLNFNISEMFESWQELAKNPESLSSKTIVIEKSKTFADSLNHRADQVQSLMEEIDLQIDKQVLDLNATVDQLDTLNRQIFNISVKGHLPNDLLDQRDKLLGDLSAITDIATTTDKYGRVAVSVGEHELLQFEAKGDLSLIQWEETSKTGALRGYFDGKEQLEDQWKDWNQLATVLADSFNAAYKSGLPEGAVTDYFTMDAAGKLGVHSELMEDNGKLLAGKAMDSPIGDGSRAAAMAAIRDANLPFDGGETTLESKYNTMVTKIGIAKEHADNMIKNQDVLVGQLESRRESTSGVSIDEEVANLVKYQKAFDANAKVMAVLTEMLDVLINRTGV